MKTLEADFGSIYELGTEVLVADCVPDGPSDMAAHQTYFAEKCMLAAEIVRRVNAHDALVEACKGALTYMEARGKFDTAEAAAPLRAALEKAGY